MTRFKCKLCLYDDVTHAVYLHRFCVETGDKTGVSQESIYQAEFFNSIETLASVLRQSSQDPAQQLQAGKPLHPSQCPDGSVCLLALCSAYFKFACELF